MNVDPITRVTVTIAQRAGDADYIPPPAGTSRLFRFELGDRIVFLQSRLSHCERRDMMHFEEVWEPEELWSGAKRSSLKRKSSDN